MQTPLQPSIIKHDRVRLETGAVHAPAGARAGVTRGVRLLEQDGVVHAIELTCSCGEVSVVELDYAPQAPSAAPHKRRPQAPETSA